MMGSRRSGRHDYSAAGQMGAAASMQKVGHAPAAPITLGRFRSFGYDI